MVRYSLLCAAFLAVVAPVHASSWADGLFDELSKDFGAVPHGTVAVHHFRITNKTAAPVRITSVRVSCGCTSARALQTYLAPGQETYILAQMDTRRFFSVKSVTIYVQFDQPNFEEARLWVQANSRDDLAFSPENINFGKVTEGTEASAGTKITFSGGAQVKLVDAKSDSNYLLTEFKEIRRDGGDVSYQVTARIRPDAPVGKWYSEVWIRTTNPSMPRLRIPLAIEITAPAETPP